MKRYYFLLLTLFVTFGSCGDAHKGAFRTDTKTSGRAKIVADGTLAPVVQELVNVFESTNAEALVFPTYTDYKNAYSLFMKDSIRLLIGPRELSDNEKIIIKDRKQILQSLKVAVDGIALIVNKENTDTLITIANIKKIMTGEIRSWKELNPNSSLGDIAVYFDSPSSSTVKYIKDSICKGDNIGDNVQAITNDVEEYIPSKESPNQLVLNHIAKTPNAIGVIGVNWISNPTDELKWTFVDKINVMNVSVEDVATKENSYPPLPYQMALRISPGYEGGYPLTREIFMIMSDPSGGLPSGFYDFAAKDRGQRLIYRAGLLPSRAQIRMVRIQSK